ncbi:hypothetical protein [Nonomuraea sp. NPDC050786]|uniref:hypothetical protein n=1 Tax=Nonomuraea sp. NPDC050786 TaxID=3154840 RepID=UPI0034071B97
MTTVELPPTTRNVPPPAAGLLRLAGREGWYSHGSWGLDGDGLPLYRVCVTRIPEPDKGLSYVHAVVVWHTGGTSRAFQVSNKVFRLEPGGPWTDLPTLRDLTHMIARSGSTKG